MKLREKLFGKRSETKKPGATSTPSYTARRGESTDQYIKRLWEEARSLGRSDKEREKALGIYTELLQLITEKTTEYNVCAILRNRAIAYRGLKNYDAALEDLANELDIAQRRGDQLRVMECRSVMEETQEWKREADIKTAGGEKAARLQEMEEQSRGLWRSGPEFDHAFNRFFADLEHEDPDVRADASRLLAESREAVQRLISIYQECEHSDPRRASLAGRVLGRKVAKGMNDMIHVEIAKMWYGISVSFIPCSCVHCGHMNKGIAAPPSGPMVPYFHQSDDQGAYAVPVLCDKCGKEFFVVWDTVPR